MCVCVQVQSFHEDASQFDDTLSFDDMNLSRPILKVNLMGDAGDGREKQNLKILEKREEGGKKCSPSKCTGFESWGPSET